MRLEDFAQILNKPRGQDFAGKYDASYEDVAAAIKQHSVRPEIDVARFLRRLIVFVLVGNCDAHLKNFSLLETTDGLRLSPAYDIVNTALYDGFDQNVALSINGKKPTLDQITRPILQNFGLSIGLSQRAVDQTFTDLHDRVRSAAGILKPPPAEPPDGFIHTLSEIVSRACQNSGGIAPLKWRELVNEALRRRKAEKLTQREHAALASVSIPTIVSFDRGEVTLTLAKAFDILRVVGLVEEPGKEGVQGAFVQEAFARWRDLTKNLPREFTRAFPIRVVSHRLRAGGRSHPGRAS